MARRLWASLMEMAEIGATPKGGVNRLTLTNLDGQSRDLFAHWCRTPAAPCGGSHGLDVRAPSRRRRSLPPVMVGSHLDTQPTGGKFDGALGVMAALEVVRRSTISTSGPGTRSRSACGPTRKARALHPPWWPRACSPARSSWSEALGKDVDGNEIGDELTRIGYAGTEQVGGRPVHALFELHIEQGPILEEEGTDIGIVTAANGQKWYEITLTGVDSHAGPTP